MASYHFEVKSGQKGSAERHACYIMRKGWLQSRGDLVCSGFGNMPAWAGNDPLRFWRAADQFERSNGAAYREMIVALPSELNSAQRDDLVSRFIAQFAGKKPYHYAVHATTSSLEGELNMHLHLMVSDRIPDGIERDEVMTFARYNRVHPVAGGCRKDSGGSNLVQMREQLIAKRKLAAELQNQVLAESGCGARVDHRSLRAAEAGRVPERHLGPARIRSMSDSEKAEYVQRRRSGLSGRSGQQGI